MKALLKIDILTNKIVNYKIITKENETKTGKEYEDEIRNFDFTVSLENINIFAEAQNENLDLFYEDGRLIVKKAKFIDDELSASERIEQIRSKKLREIEETNYKHYCSICLIIRDENEYLKEWLDWHISQSVEHFYIYDHGSKQPVSEFVESLGESIAKKVTVIDHSGCHEHAQHEAYNNCLQRFGNESRWIGFFDSDEMVRVKNGKKITQFLKEFEDYAGLFITWIIYGANEQIHKSDLPCRVRFTQMSPQSIFNGLGKVFIQPAYMRRMVTHNGYPIEGFEVVDENKETVEEAAAWKSMATTQRICVDHYYTKSYQEWVEKLSRGTCDPYFNRKYNEFFLHNPDLFDCREKNVPTQDYEKSKKITTKKQEKNHGK